MLWAETDGMPAITARTVDHTTTMDFNPEYFTRQSSTKSKGNWQLKIFMGLIEHEQTEALTFNGLVLTVCP
jgi:hypothetical protein